LRIRAGRVVVKVAILSVLFAVGWTIVPVAAQAVAESYQLDISRQPLDAALKDLAQQTGLQIARFSDVPASNPLVGPLAGEMSLDNALRTLLTPNRLTYKVVNNRTIAVVALDSNATSAGPEVSASTPHSSANTNADGQEKEGKKNSSSGFRLAQMDQGAPAGSTSVAPKGEEVSERKAQYLEEVIVTARKRDCVWTGDSGTWSC
jgi:hypothetical protein